MALNSLERRSLFGLSLLYATRMLGLFMVLPVLTLYGQDLSGATSFSLGLALGIYGITQALLQIPFGAASDRYGRKLLMTIGLVIFFLGSALAALSDSVIGLIIGRALQGGGAISSVVLALLADYTREEERSKAMAVVGAVIGASFVLAVVLGPWIAGFGGLSGLFWFTSALALTALLIVWWLPPVPGQQIHQERKVHLSQIGRVFSEANVNILSLGIFALHMSMTALFVALPIVLVQRGFAAENLGVIYAPVMILSFIAMVPMMMMSERRKAHFTFMRIASALMVLALVLIFIVNMQLFTAIGLFLFFVGFNFMEATLPSLLSRRVSATVRGTAMGVFSTGQFLGAAAGGMVGGLIFGSVGLVGIVLLGCVCLSAWSILVGRLSVAN